MLKSMLGQIAVVKTDTPEALKNEIAKEDPKIDILYTQIPAEAEFVLYINGLVSTLVSRALFRNRFEGLVLIDAGDGDHGDRFMAVLELLSLLSTGRWIICVRDRLPKDALRALIRFGIPFAQEYFPAEKTGGEIREQIEAYALQHGLTLRTAAPRVRPSSPKSWSRL